MKKLLLLLITLSVALAAPAALAQPKGAADKRAKVEARMKELRGRVLKKEVGLDDAKAAQVEKVLSKYAPERKKLQQEAQKHRRAIRDLLKKDSNDQAAYERAIKGLRAAQNKLHALREKELDELSKLLTPKQQAKLAVAIRRLQAKLRRRMRELSPAD